MIPISHTLLCSGPRKGESYQGRDAGLLKFKVQVLSSRLPSLLHSTTCCLRSQETGQSLRWSTSPPDSACKKTLRKGRGRAGHPCRPALCSVLHGPPASPLHTSPPLSKSTNFPQLPANSTTSTTSTIPLTTT